MNEVQLIRGQLGAERQHAGAVALACASALGRGGSEPLPSGSPLEEFRQACVDYLVCVLVWFEERDRRLAGLVRALAAAQPLRAAVEEGLARGGGNRDALEKLEAAFAGTATPGGGPAPDHGWREFAQFLSGPWSARREALELLLATGLRTADWRTIAAVDADSILEERSRYARVEQLLPAGAALAAAAADGA